MVLLEGDSTRFDAFFGSKDIGAPTGGTLHDIAHCIVKAIGWMRELGEFRRPAGSSSVEDNGNFIAFLLTFRCKRQGIEDSPKCFLGTTLWIG